MVEQTQQQRRVMPQSELDFHLMTTDSVWGKAEVSPELRTVLNKYFLSKNKEGENVVTKQSLWGLLGFYTRDMRLANLSTKDGEMEFCQYYLDLSNDFLQAGNIEPFLISLSRVATRLELSQSKSGFLRKQMNTMTMQNLQGEVEPQKKSLFGLGGSKKGEVR